MVEAVQIGNDLRQGGADNRLVERGEQEAEQDARDRPDQLPPVEFVESPDRRLPVRARRRSHIAPRSLRDIPAGAASIMPNPIFTSTTSLLIAPFPNSSQMNLLARVPAS